VSYALFRLRVVFVLLNETKHELSFIARLAVELERFLYVLVVIPVFRYSGIPVFRYSGIPVFRYSGIPVFRYSGIPVFRYFTACASQCVLN